MNKLITSLIFVVLTGSLAYGSEDFLTGQQLLNICNSKTPNDQSLCYGYVTGITEAGIVSEDLCMDVGITYERTMKKSVEYLNSHPDSLHGSAVLLLLQELKSVHPCEHSEH